MAERRDMTGWLLFAVAAGSILALFNFMYGLVLLFNDTWVVLSEEGLLVFDLTLWGWILLLLGVVQLFVVYGIASGATWARASGIVWTTVIMFGHIAALTVYPLWSLIMIVICFYVIYALTVQMKDELV